MATTTISFGEVLDDSPELKAATKNGAVFLTENGRPSHVLLSIAEYNRLLERKRNLVEALSMPGLADIAFDPDPPRCVTRPADCE